MTPRGGNWEEGWSTGNSLVKNIMKNDSIKIYIQGFLFMLKTLPYVASFDSITLKIDSSLSMFNNSLLAWLREFSTTKPALQQMLKDLL